MATVAEDAAAAVAFSALAQARPLACARLWDRAPPATSQRRILDGLVAITLVSGGNRSGKTSLGAQLAVATALGATHPDVRAWWRLNRLPLDLVPGRPGSVWAVALDSGDSREYVRPAVARYLPAGCTWRNREGAGYAEVALPGGGTIGFKSVDEGRDGFQGTEKDLVWFDEEPTEAVVDEAMMRLVDRRGRLLITMTPLKGRTWVWQRWIAQHAEDVRVHTLHGTDNPHLPPGALEAVLRRYGPLQRAARERGEFTTLEGRVYEFSPHVHVVHSFVPPTDWRRYAAIDFGVRNPFAYLYAAVDPADDVLHIVAEHYEAQQTIAHHAGRIRALEAGGPVVSARIADPEDAQARLTLAREHGISTIAGRKDRAIGINTVAERFAPDAAGKPHLVVHDRCVHVMREIESYRWDTSQAAAARERTLGDDHALDALRYLCMFLRRREIGVG